MEVFKAANYFVKPYVLLAVRLYSSPSVRLCPSIRMSVVLSSSYISANNHVTLRYLNVLP